MNRMSRIAVAIVPACLVSACYGGATPGPVSHSPYDLPTETGSAGLYLRNCLDPNTGLITGSDAPTRIDSADILVIIRCEPDAGHDAVRVSQATGDVRWLIDTLAKRPTASSSSTGKQTVFVIFKRDDTKSYLTATGVPISAIDAAKFQVVGTTPSGSL